MLISRGRKFWYKKYYLSNQESIFSVVSGLDFGGEADEWGDSKPWENHIKRKFQKNFLFSLFSWIIDLNWPVRKTLHVVRWLWKVSLLWLVLRQDVDSSAILWWGAAPLIASRVATHGTLWQVPFMWTYSIRYLWDHVQPRESAHFYSLSIPPEIPFLPA